MNTEEQLQRELAASSELATQLSKQQNRIRVLEAALEKVKTPTISLGVTPAKHVEQCRKNPQTLTPSARLMLTRMAKLERDADEWQTTAHDESDRAERAETRVTALEATLKQKMDELACFVRIPKGSAGSGSLMAAVEERDELKARVKELEAELITAHTEARRVPLRAAFDKAMADADEILGPPDPETKP